MITKINSSTSSKPHAAATRQRLSHRSKPEATAWFTLVLAWAFVLVPLAWGIYETVRITRGP